VVCLILGAAWKKIIAFFAPIAFGVYLIHEEPLIRDNFINGRFKEYLQFNPVVMVLLVLATAFAIWFICSLIDRLRLKLFEVLKVKQLAGDIEDSLKNKFNKILLSLNRWIKLM
jgi:hypothetical protein